MKTYLNITPEELYDVRKKVSNRVLNSIIDINNSPSKKEVLFEIVRTKEAIEHLLNILFESKYPIVDKSMLVSKDLVDCFVDIIVLNHYIVNKFESKYCDTDLYVCDSNDSIWNNDVRNSEDAALMLMDEIHRLNDIFREFLLNINNVPNMISMRLDTSRRYDVTFSNSRSNKSSLIYKNNELALSFNMWLMTHCRWIYNIVNKLGLFKEKSCTISDSGNAKISAYSSGDDNETVNGRMFDINMNINRSRNTGVHYEPDSTGSLVEQMLDAAYNVAIASLAAHADDKYFSSEDE